MNRNTKIIATIGPASESETNLREMIEAGMDVARLGLAHGTLEEHLERYNRIRKVAKACKRPVGILVDLPGPKVRASQLPEEGITLADGTSIRLEPGPGPSSNECIFVEYESLITDLQIGDRIAVGDGATVAQVEENDGSALHATVTHGGVLRGRPGVHIPSDRLRLTTPTTEDLRLLDAFVHAGVDMVALSFVRSGHDVRRVGTEAIPKGPLVVAKIETQAAVQNLEGILEAAGAIMIARGDLGVECPIEDLPHLQKQIIRECIAHGRPAITATQMLESMVQAPTPTRAESSDVANAVFDGSSAVMLSGETAIGRNPVQALKTMVRIATRADQEFNHDAWGQDITRLRLREQRDENDAVSDAMTMAAWRAATQVDAAAILCLSRSGFTVRSMARFRPTATIIGLSPNERTVQQLTLSWGARPIMINELSTTSAMIERAINIALENGYVRGGDLVAVLAGSDPTKRATNQLRLIRVTYSSGA